MKHFALDQALRFLDSWLAYRARQANIPGFSVAIAHKDKIVLDRAYGAANIETREPLTTQHLFGVASQTKMFTATAIMQLMQQGRLRLDDYACAYLPWLTKHRDQRYQSITIRQLLSHSAGLLRDGRNSNYWQNTHPFPDARALRAIILATDLAAQPNTKLKYSNLGYALLGQIIEKVSGQPYTHYIREHIIAPLKLQNTFINPSDNEGQYTAGHTLPHMQRRRPLQQTRNAMAFAAVVGLYSTPADMCRFAMTHFFGNEQLLSDECKREMQRSQWAITSGHDADTHYGLGFNLQTIDDRQTIGHGGHINGYVTSTFFDPHDRLAVSVMANARDADITPMIYGIFEALNFFDRNATESTPPELARFATRLRSPISTMEIVATKDRIVALDPDDWQPFSWCEELEQTSPTSLRVTTPGSFIHEDESLHYTFDQDTVAAVNYAGFTLLPEDQYDPSA